MGIPVEESGRFAARFLTQNPKVAGLPPSLDPEAADAPDCLLPGGDVRLTPMLALLERRGYRRADVTFNMDVDLAALDGLAGPEPASSVRAASPADRDRFAEWLRRHWPNWEDEAL